jgi:very-short-patch-repair endonuclease
MHRRTGPKTFAHAYELRRNMTEAETRLWQVLRSHRFANIHFRRQHAVGPYIVDFCAPRIKLAIEVDGDQHLDQQEYDAQRSAFLESNGYRVLRFWNGQVTNDMAGVIKHILAALETPTRR